MSGSEENASTEEQSGEVNEVYGYVHFAPMKTGDKFERRIISLNLIKKFNFQDYQVNNNVYKDKHFKVTIDGQKRKCFVLYASESYQDVEEQSLKRCSIPIHSDTIDDSGNANGLKIGITNESDVSEDSISNAPIAELITAKRKRKQTNLNKKKNKRNQENLILKNYFNASTSKNGDGGVVETPCNQQLNGQEISYQISPLTSTPILNKVANKDAAIAGYKTQLQYLVDKASVTGSEEKGIKTIQNKEFELLDKIYLSNEAENQNQVQNCESNSKDGSVYLGDNVYCNAKAFYDSLNSSNPKKCLYILSQGVYGTEDLANRCVRKQRNTIHKKLLSPQKSIAIERQVYKYMRTNNFTIHQINNFRHNLNVYHHNAISSASSRLKTEKKLQEEEARIDAELLNNQSSNLSENGSKQ